MDALQKGLELGEVMGNRLEYGVRHTEGFPHLHQLLSACGGALSMAAFDQPVDYRETVGFPAQLRRIVAQSETLGTAGPGVGILLVPSGRTPGKRRLLNDGDGAWLKGTVVDAG